MKLHLFFKLLIVAIVGLTLAKICYYFSGDFFQESFPKKTWSQFVENSTVSFSTASIPHSETYTHVNKIIIDNINSDITLNGKNAQAGKVQVKINSNRQMVFISNANHTLTVKLPGRTSVLFTVPSEVKDIEVHTKSGDVNITGLNITNLSIDSLSGDLALSEVSADQASLKSMSGNIDWTGFVKKLQLKTISGDVQLKSSYNNPEYNIEAVSGNATIITSVPLNASLDVKSVSGNVSANPTTAIKQNSKPAGIIKVRSISGDISVNGK